MSVAPTGLVDTPTGPGRDCLVEAIAAAVLACPLVARLHAGSYGQVGTYLPGRRIVGIQATETEWQVHVVARYPATMAAVADQVRAALAAHAGGFPVMVVIEDLALPDEEADAAQDPVKEL